MTLVDTSVWVEHLRAMDGRLATMLNAGQVLVHPFIIGEIALGHLKKRDVVLDALSSLPQATLARDHEVLHFIDRHDLAGSGIGYVDAHLLASAQLTAGAALWTHDRRLRDAAGRLGLTAERHI